MRNRSSQYRISFSRQASIKKLMFGLIIFTIIDIKFILNVNAKSYPQIYGKPEYLTLPINKTQEISLPFQRVFQIYTQISFNKKYINFHPTSIKLQKIKKSILLENFSQNSQSILEDLRTPFPLQYKQILKLKEFIIVLIAPNKIMIIQQNQQHFSILNTFVIEQSKNPTSVLKLYILNGKQAIGYLFQGEQMFLINSIGYTKLKNNQIKTLTHLVTFSNNQFFTSEYQNCINHYKINRLTLQIQPIKKFTPQQLQIESCSATDININYFQSTNSIYMLDQNFGVLQIFYKKAYYKDKQIAYQSTYNGVIIDQQDCMALDYIEMDRFVLVCQRESQNFIVEAYIENPSSNERIITKMEPVFYDCSFQDLQITPDYYIAFQYGSIQLFWSRKSNYLPELMRDKKDINLLNLQTFRVYTQQTTNKLNVYLYSIRSNVLIKQKLSQQPFKLTVSSSQTIKKTFQIKVQGKCQQIIEASLKNKIKIHEKQLSKIKSGDQVCLFRKTIELDVSPYYGERRGDISLAASFFVICLMIVITLACLCIYKYNGIQHRAMQRLEMLKKQHQINANQHIKFVL